VSGARDRAAPRGERTRKPAVAGAKIERHGKFPVDDIEPVDQPVGDFGMQEIDRSTARRTVAVSPPGVTVEEGVRLQVGWRHRCGNLTAAGTE